MPIRPALRKFYSGPAWRETRKRILARAGGIFDDRGRYRGGAKCEECGVVDRKTALRACSWWTPATLEATVMMGNGTIAGRTITQLPWQFRAQDEPAMHGFPPEICHWVGVVLTVAHLNHVPGDDRDENLKALCQWCHLNYDKLHHRDTRCERKDAHRPILQEATHEEADEHPVSPGRCTFPADRESAKRRCTTKRENATVAYGEVTGHSHACRRRTAIVRRGVRDRRRPVRPRDGCRDSRIDAGATFVHEEHGPITLPPGTTKS
jgi:hypothetical protein